MDETTKILLCVCVCVHVRVFICLCRFCLMLINTIQTLILARWFVFATRRQAPAMVMALRWCLECSKTIPSNKALHGQMRFHHRRSYRGINHPNNATKAAKQLRRSDWPHAPTPAMGAIPTPASHWRRPCSIIPIVSTNNFSTSEPSRSVLQGVGHREILRRWQVAIRSSVYSYSSFWIIWSKV